jgi:hypothetical protein
MLPAGTATMAIGGALRLLGDAVREGKDVGAVAPDLYFALLMPYVGAEAAEAERLRAYG